MKEILLMWGLTLRNNEVGCLEGGVHCEQSVGFRGARAEHV